MTQELVGLGLWEGLGSEKEDGAPRTEARWHLIAGRVVQRDLAISCIVLQERHALGLRHLLRDAPGNLGGQ